ncbi:hypothetical protein [Streptomyces sp. NPDC004726]
MEFQSLQDLLKPDGRTPAFTPWGLGRMEPEDAVRFQQEQTARCELVPEVGEAVRESFGKLRPLFARGVLDYGTYAQISAQAALIPERALRERFVQWCEGEVTFEDANGIRQPRTRPVASQHDVSRLSRKLPNGPEPRRSRWMLRVDNELIEFNGMLSSLMRWARTAGLLHARTRRDWWTTGTLSRTPPAVMAPAPWKPRESCVICPSSSTTCGDTRPRADGSTRRRSGGRSP